MQKFIFALFSFVALLGLVLPTFAHGGRNGDRLARGLRPFPPSRRSSARRAAPSSNPNNGHHTDRIRIRDPVDNTWLGYLTDFTSGDGGDLLVTYYHGSHLLSFKSKGAPDAHFLGTSVSYGNLGPKSDAIVYLTNVALSDHKANAHIWTLNGDNQLIPIWPSSHGSATPVDISINSEQGAIALTGDPSLLPSGWKQVEFYLEN